MSVAIKEIVYSSYLAFNQYTKIVKTQISDEQVPLPHQNVFDEYMEAVSEGYGSGGHLANQVADVRIPQAAQGSHRRWCSNSSQGNSARVRNDVDRIGAEDGFGEGNNSESDGL